MGAAGTVIGAAAAPVVFVITKGLAVRAAARWRPMSARRVLVGIAAFIMVASPRLRRLE